MEQIEQLQDNSGFPNYAIHRLFLKTSCAYNDLPCDVKFSYELDDEARSNFENIKSLLDINSLRGSNEIDTFINATNWVARILSSSLEPTINRGFNSFQIITDVLENKFGANCYAHAVVLCDLFSILGYKSRFVFCLPIDYHYTDNHVVTIVYYEQEKRWLLFDAAQNMYFADANNRILDVRELRNAVINDDFINVNFLDVHWKDIDNRNREIVKRQIMIYMAKNLYRFACFSNSHTDRIAKERIVNHYNLVPVNYITTPFSNAFYIKERKVKFLDTYVSNPSAFWALPVEDSYVA